MNALHMQVVAHEDDEILFMNPDLAASVTTGVPTVTVFLSAGDITGDPCPNICHDVPGQPIRARSRQLGVMNAYALMAGVGDGSLGTDETSHWTGEVWTLGGHQVERYILNEGPVHLVFVNLHDGALAAIHDNALADTTVVPLDSPLPGPSVYTAADVVDLLRLVMADYQPTVLRTQDRFPDQRYAQDHPDHVAAARFAAEAAAAYGGELIQVDYRDYNIADCPGNLDPAATTAKGGVYAEYATHDHSVGNYDPAWFSRQYYRWSRGTGWAGLNQDGRPQVFLVRKGAPYTYWRGTGGTWFGPQQLASPGGPLAPAFSVGMNQNGRMELFGRRLNDHHIVSLAQNTANGGWGAVWTDHGNPNTGTGFEAQVGTPVVASNLDGRLQFFLKNAGGGVSTRWQTAPNGPWTGAWGDMGGSDLQDPVTVVRNGQGRLEVFASTRTSVLAWWQTSPSGSFAGPGALPNTQPASPPKAALHQDGRIQLAYRKIGTGSMMTTSQLQVGGSWSQTPVDIGGDSGVGEPAAVTAAGKVVLFERNGGTGVSRVMQTAPNGSFGAWADLGHSVLDYPAAVVDGAGLLHVFAIGADAQVYFRTGTGTGGAWQGPL
ncbi:PIG-L family deacetylase [Kitasatospora sp. NPDC002040]|uniref:PIG-L family deacetylase n=1 Tax=Kitasatospora sp. NPDC002040 TaxID=3154661 RepID=UPI00332B69A6